MEPEGTGGAGIAKRNGQPSPTGQKADFPTAWLADLFEKWERLGGRLDGQGL